MTKFLVKGGRCNRVVSKKRCSHALFVFVLSRFEALFTAMDANIERLGISSWGASVTTLEEVFLK